MAPFRAIAHKSSYRRLRNPPKIYLADTGLCRRVTAADTGRLLENLVYLELRRRGRELFYFERSHECDFVTRDEAGDLAVYQVTTELAEHTRAREVAGLLEAARAVGAKRGTIITLTGDAEWRQDGVHVTVVPAWRWLLRQ